MKKYRIPTLDIILFQAADVITLSGADDNLFAAPGEWFEIT